MREPRGTAKETRRSQTGRKTGRRGPCPEATGAGLHVGESTQPVLQWLRDQYPDLSDPQEAIADVQENSISRAQAG